MAQIRTTIELLTKILRENGFTRVKAEIFRLSKFNQEEAVKPIWKLLFELIYYCDFGKIDDVTIKAYGMFSSEELVVFVKKEIQKRGFYSRDFANLPADQIDGSRELLLALGWLLCKENIVHRFMQNCTSPLDDDTYDLHQPTASSAQKQLDPASMSLDPAERVKQLLWLNNKLRLSLRNLLSMQKEKNMLKHKLHEATMGVSLSPGRNHLSMLEIYMLKHPELLKKNLQLLERDNERLTNLLKWKDHEDIFWKWMESVLDTKLQEISKAGPPKDTTPDPMTYNIPPDGVRRLHESRQNLQEAIMKYEGIVENLEKLWVEKSEHISEEEIDSVLASLDLELAMQKANIAVNEPEETVSNRQPTFVLEKKATRKPVVKHQTVDMSSGDCNFVDIQGEISSLNALVDRLQHEVEDKQNSFKEEMQNLSDKFKDAICIPPMSIKT